MDMNNVNIEEIVKQVLSGMTGNAPAAAASSKRSGCSGRKHNPEKSKSSNDDREETF